MIKSYFESNCINIKSFAKLHNLDYVTSKYAALIFDVKIVTLQNAAMRNSTRYTYTKYQNKLLFKVSPAQLSIALNKGLIDVNTPIFNDDLTLIQDFFKTNLRRKNGRERNDKTPSKVCKSIREHAIYDDKSAFRCDEKPNSSYQTALFCRLSDSNRQKSVCRTCKNAGDTNHDDKSEGGELNVSGEENYIILK